MGEVHPEIRKFLDAYKDSVYRKDYTALARLYAEEVLIYDMWGRFSIKGRAPWAEELRAWLTGVGEERVEVDFDEVQSELSGSLGFAAAAVSFRAVSPAGEILRSMKNRFTWVFAERGGKLLVVHQHSSAPLDPATSKAVFGS